MPERSLVSGSPPSKLVLTDETNSKYKKEYENQLLLSIGENNLKKERANELEIVSRCEIIIGGQSTVFRVLRYFYECGCSFAADIEKTLLISRATAHRHITKLNKAGFIEPLTKTHIPRKDGPKVSLYGVLDVTKEEIDKAITRLMQYSSKNYAYVDALYQRTLPEIHREEIQFSKIVNLARKQGNSGFLFMDIAELAAKKHQENGVKVWR